ncbi:hypothetical protein ACFX1Q_016150 [Malus domestica]
MEMAPSNQKFHFFSILVTTLFYTNVLSDNTTGLSSLHLYPLTCSTSHHTQTCNSSLYHISKGNRGNSHHLLSKPIQHPPNCS